MIPRIPRFALLLLLVPLVAVAMACSGDSDAAEPEPTAEQMTPRTTSTAGGAATGSPVSFAKPPAASAASGAAEVTMGTGTYCWSAPSQPGLCRDMAGPITGIEELVVPRGGSVAVMTQFPGGSIHQAAVNAHDVGTMQGTPEGAAELSWNFPLINGQPLSATTTTTGLEFVADLDPGRYVVTVFLQVPEGDVAYGVVLDVR